MNLKILAGLSVAALTFGAVSEAREEEQKIAVLPCTGPGAAKVTSKLSSGLDGETTIDVVPGSKVKRVVKRKLVKGSAFSKASRQLGVDAFVGCQVAKQGSGWKAKLSVRDSKGKLLDKMTWDAKRPGAAAKVPLAVRLRMTRALNGADEASEEDDAPRALAEAETEEDDAPVRGRRAAREESEEAEPEAEEEEAETPRLSSRSDRRRLPDVEVSSSREERDGPQGPRFVAVSVAPSVLSRRFDYSDTLPAGTRAYRHALPAAATLALSAEVFPSLGAGVLSQIGAHASALLFPGLKTQLSDGQSFQSTAFAYEGGLKLRLPISRSHVDLGLGVGHQVFDLGIVNNREKDGPSVAYTYLQPSVAARVAFTDKISAEAGAGFRFLQSAGEISSAVYLKRASSGGIDAQAAVHYELLKGLDVRLAGNYRRYFMKAMPIPGDPLTEGSATDEYYQASLGMAYRLNF